MHIQRKSLFGIRIFMDMIVLVSVLIFFILTMKNKYTLIFRTNEEFLLCFLPITWIISSKITHLYDEFRSRNFSYELITIIKNIFIQTFSAIVIMFFLKEYILSRLSIFLYSFGLLFSLALEKYIVRQTLNYLRRKGRNLRNLLIIGAGDVGMGFYSTVRNNPHFGYHLLGFLDDQKKSNLNGEYLGTIDQLENILEKEQVDDVIVALPNIASTKIGKVIRTCEEYTTRVKIIPDYFEFISNSYNVSTFGSFPIISIREDHVNELHWRVLKRIFDIIFTIFLFVFIFSWLWPLIGIIIRITSPGPIFFKQERWGRDNKKFLIVKFRTMNHSCKEFDQNGKFIQVSRDDARVTKFGKFLRKTNLDELPQFINVLKGNMSIVGPRPLPTPLILESKKQVKKYLIRHLVKPGLTGWAQVNGYRGETKDIFLMKKRVEHDIWYIENWSFLLDIQIIFLTIWKMIKGDPNAY